MRRNADTTTERGVAGQGGATGDGRTGEARWPADENEGEGPAAEEHGAGIRHTSDKARIGQHRREPSGRALRISD